MTEEKRASIDFVLARAGGIPPLPAAIAQLLGALDSDAGIAEIASLVARDIALTSRVLRIANGTTYAHLGSPVSTASQAVARLGLTELRNIALSMAVIGALLPKRESRRLHYPEFWLHCATAATAMGSLVSRVRGTPKARGGDDVYFLAGLVHDIGTPLLSNALGARYDQVLTENDASDEPLWETELRVLGFHHGEVGAVALAEWSFPETAQVCALWHHQPDQAPPSAQQLAGWVHLADWMTHVLGHGNSCEGNLPMFDDATWGSLGVTFDLVRDVTSDFAAAAEKSREIVNAAL